MNPSKEYLEETQDTILGITNSVASLLEAIRYLNDEFDALREDFEKYLDNNTKAGKNYRAAVRKELGIMGWRPVLDGRFWQPPADYVNKDGTHVAGIIPAKEVPQEVMDAYNEKSD